MVGFEKTKIVYFDGHCNVCNRFVDFLLRHDARHSLKYAPLQGITAAQNLAPALRTDLATMVLQDGDVFYVESSAAIRTLAHLGGGFKLMSVFLMVPRWLRDTVYRWVANHRYLIAGKRDTCRLPTPAELAQFLD